MLQTFPLIFNLYALPFLLACALIAFMGIYVSLHGARGEQKTAFMVLSASFFVWLGGTFIVYSIRQVSFVMPLLYVVYVGVSLISPSLYWYAAAWLGYSRQDRLRIISGFVLAGLIAFLIPNTSWIMIGAHKFPWGYHSKLSVWGGAFYLCFFLGYMGLFFWTLYRGYQRETTSGMKRQILLVAISFIIANIGTSDFLACYGQAVFPLGGLVMTLGLSTLAYTIIRYKLLEIETAVHKTALWFASTIVTIVPFAAFVYASQTWALSLSPLAATFLATVMAVVFYFYFGAIQPLLGQLFRRRHADLEKARNAFSDELVHLKNIRDLLQGFVRMLRRTIYVREISIFLRDDKESRFVPAIVKRRHGLKAVPADHPFLKWLEMHNELVMADYAESDPEVVGFKDEMKSYFNQTGAILALPFTIGGKMIGVLHLGKKETLRRYSPAERAFLSQIKVPVTIAFSNSLQFEDVSRLYKQVQTQNHRLQELDRLKSQFLANTSHELRTPLNGILGLVEAVLDGADGAVNKAQSRHLRMILESGANLKELINNLLELSKLESGQTQLNIKPFNVLNAVTVVLALLEGIAHKKGVQLKCESEKDLPDVYGDPEKIQRVLLNLAGNALKFTEKGSVVIRLKTFEGVVRVSIEDTGIGIKEQDLKVIFERFRQADGGETRNYEGTGLGLSIARDIVRLHRSEISVTSQFGQGSAFSFEMLTVPFEQAVLIAQEGPVNPAVEPVKGTEGMTTPANASAEAAREKIYDAPHDPEEEAIVRGQGELVLVVDDNSVNREVIRTRLGMNNYLVVEAVDGQDALEKVKAEKPALVLLDLMMPRMSGYEFCKEVRRLYPADELPIIMLTAKTDMGDKVFGLNIGANDYISKPFQQEELLARVGVLLRIRAMHEELRRWNDQLEARVEERTRELHATQKQLIQAEKMATVGTFAGGIAHEINNPLTAVLTNAQVLKMTSVNEEDKELVDLIEEGAKRCQVIIQKLMKYSRKADIGSVRQPVSLEKVVQSVCALLSYQFQQDNIVIEQDLAGFPLIQGNEGELEQVFTNMILNAKDAILSQGRTDGTIRIQGRATGSEVRIEVVDNGTGIKKENLTKIFDPFFTTKDVGSGTGLGLSVTHGILERHSCRVFVESEWGVGTTFVLVFPLKS